jgi:hypothetical protein
LVNPDAPWTCSERKFDFLYFTIQKHGDVQPWRRRRDKVLYVGRYVYWCTEDGGVINRCYRESHMNGGRPSEKVLKRLRKRFWPTREDRKYYNYIAQS